MSNSEDPDEMAHWAVSSDLCCLHTPIIIVCDSEGVNLAAENFGGFYEWTFMQICILADFDLKKKKKKI